MIVEEYFPARLATRRDGVEVAPAAAAQRDDFAAGLAGFLATARTLARLRDRHIVPVLRWTGANGTGYVVTEDVDGETLSLRLERDATLSDDELKALMRPIIAGLGAVHGAGLLHRQINPEAIVLRPDGTPVLRGFGVGAKAAGGARQVFDPRAATLADIVPGYTALEQYSAGGREGPWTDVYALGAVMYHCVAGAAPADAPFRALRADPAPATLFADTRDARMLAAIDAALAVAIASRPQSLPVWQAMLFGDAQRTLAANRAGRTSARGFGRAAATSPLPGAPPHVPAPPAGATEAPGTGRRLLRWSVPALAATAVIALMTWVDTGVLRSRAAPPPAGTAARPAGAEFSDPLRGGGAGPAMVVVPPGSTRLGCFPADCPDPESPPREVVFDEPFALGKHEVTEADYARFAAAGDRRRPAPGRARLRPVADVSWDDARAYAAWLSAETGRGVPAADRGGMGVRRPRRRGGPAVRARRRRRSPAGAFPRRDRGHSARERVGIPRHARQRVGVDVRLRRRDPGRAGLRQADPARRLVGRTRRREARGELRGPARRGHGLPGRRAGGLTGAL